jgi:hypothetical protein
MQALYWDECMENGTICSLQILDIVILTQRNTNGKYIIS